ncbi:DnaD domain protein [Limosilactobacillus mucosae]|uniref:DnaD domain protein n=1 Tax=Limosilactobacillus mucosae TaxID=97478 RepID=UPI0022E3DBAD|nr:DnaD domain protein [Limosilactobacillus mucosae]
MVRIKKDYSKGFTTMNNTIVRDDSLSWKARGIFAYLWSMPDDWNFYETEVAKHATDGRQSLRTGLEELEKNGYLERTRSRDKLGKFGAPVWILHDEPATTHSPMSDYPTLDKPTSDYPTSGNRTLLNKYLTKETSTNEIQEERDVYKAPLDKNEKLSFIRWPDSLGAMTDLISKLLLDAFDQGMSADLIQKAIDITKYADPGTPYGYLKSVLSDWLSQGIYTMQDWQQHQQKKQAAKHRDIPDIPIYKI